jgi:hypothetical protein
MVVAGALIRIGNQVMLQTWLQGNQELQRLLRIPNSDDLNVRTTAAFFVAFQSDEGINERNEFEAKLRYKLCIMLPCLLWLASLSYAACMNLKATVIIPSMLTVTYPTLFQVPG